LPFITTSKVETIRYNLREQFNTITIVSDCQVSRKAFKLTNGAEQRAYLGWSILVFKFTVKQSFIVFSIVTCLDLGIVQSSKHERAKMTFIPVHLAYRDKGLPG